MAFLWTDGERRATRIGLNIRIFSVKLTDSETMELQSSSYSHNEATVVENAFLFEVMSNVFQPRGAYFLFIDAID